MHTESQMGHNPAPNKRVPLRERPMPVGIHRQLWRFARLAGSEFMSDDALRLAAALAYYTIFSLVPLLMMVIAVAGLLFGEEAVSNELVAQLRRLIGINGATAIQQLIAGAAEPTRSRLATVIGGVTLGVGATGVFTQLQFALNTIWNVKTKPGTGFRTLIRKRALSFGMVLGIGFLLLVSLVVSSALAAVSRKLGDVLPGSTLVWQVFDFFVSAVVATGLFSLIFKILPEARVEWRDVWIGALVSALIFNLAKLGLGLYIGNGSFGTEFGAAASLISILLWIYVSAAVMFYGAEFTKVYAHAHGRGVIPSRHAVIRDDHSSFSGTRSPEGAAAAASREQRKQRTRAAREPRRRR